MAVVTTAVAVVFVGGQLVGTMRPPCTPYMYGGPKAPCIMFGIPGLGYPIIEAIGIPCNGTGAPCGSSIWCGAIIET